MKKAFRLLATDIQNKIEEAGFSIRLQTDGVYEFGKYSSAGQDFRFDIDIGADRKEFADNILKYYENFDPSEEAYLWLDNTGHGINGAPYDMKDVYENMEECKEFIYKLYEIVSEFC